MHLNEGTLLWIISIREEMNITEFLSPYWLYSAVSRAILKSVYRFSIPNSDPKTLKSVKIHLKIDKWPFMHYLSTSLSYLECKIAKSFWGFAPGPQWEGLQCPPDTPAAQQFFFSLCLSKNWHLKKILRHCCSNADAI